MVSFDRSRFFSCVLIELKLFNYNSDKEIILAAVAEARDAWSAYQALAGKDVKLPIWAVAENYRFEPALIQVSLS